MATMIFVNLPVKDLDKSKAFFAHLGYTFNEQFTNEKAACMVISDTIFCMLLTEAFFKTFIKKEICNATRSTETILSLSANSKAEVEATVNKAVEAGGTATDVRDYGWMFQWGFEDLDGHMWELAYMDMGAIPQQP